MLKSGTNVYSNGLRFEYTHRGCVPRVTVYDSERTHNTIATFNTELLTSKQELEELVAWWIYDNGPNTLDQMA